MQSTTTMLEGTALGPSNGFNWIYLINLLICGILAIFFLFYFNRLFATVVSYGIRTWTWRYYQAYVDITALQISFLGGRVFFKGVRYHAHNITVLVHEGHITWRYWLPVVQKAEVLDNDNSKSDEKIPVRDSQGKENYSSESSSHNQSQNIEEAERAQRRPHPQPPCRISIKISGVETFIYNRSPVFDSMLEAASRRSEDSQRPQFENDENSLPEALENRASPQDNISEDKQSAASLPFWLRGLPIHIECKLAAVALGNRHTTSILTAKLEKATGTIDAGHASKLDIFKLIFAFDFEKFHMAMKPNSDYQQSQLSSAAKIARESRTGPTEVNELGHVPKSRIHRSWSSIIHYITHYHSLKTFHFRRSSTHTEGISTKHANSKLPGQDQWHGLQRYLDDDLTICGYHWQDVEYAKSSTLADCDKLHFRFYWDIPGQVLNSAALNTPGMSIPSSVEDINGAKPPDYGMEFGVHGGLLCYGPWADRQRANLQQAFFPASFVDAEPMRHLKVGQYRLSTIFKIFVSVEEDVVVRIPTREASKDGRWQDTAHGPEISSDQNLRERRAEGDKSRKQRSTHKKTNFRPPTDVRPYGWLDITIKANSSVTYQMDMFARPLGFQNMLDLDIKGTEMTSSVNHGILWRAGALTMKADLSNSLTWNSVRHWPFDVICDDLELFILRDHMFLITDIVNDWSTGPGPDYFTFVPYVYKLNLTFRKFTLFLNVNDANIINDPADMDKNDFLALEGNRLQGAIGIPMSFYRPERSDITFDVVAHHMRLRLSSPLRSTLRTLVYDKDVAQLPHFTLRGSYSGHAKSMPGVTDLLRMDISGSELRLKAYGFLVRQLINLKENYFGDWIHFKTLEEHQASARGPPSDSGLGRSSDLKVNHSNELDVILCVVVDDAIVMLPTNLYSAQRYVKVELPLANLDLRVASYYLDLGLSLSPISLSSSSLVDQDEATSPDGSASGTQIVIGHVDLDGHRAFGLPPAEPAYAGTWDIDVGNVVGQCSSDFARDVTLAGKSFALAFADGENAWPISSPNVFPDATFVQLITGDFRLWLLLDTDAVLFTSKPITVHTNGLVGRQFSQQISLRIPLVTFACVDAKDALRRGASQKERPDVEAFALFETGVSADVVMTPSDLEVARRRQQEYIRIQDHRTKRCQFLLQPADILSDPHAKEIDSIPPALPCPSLPFPQPREPFSKSTGASVHRIQKRNSSSTIASSIRSAASMIHLREVNVLEVPTGSAYYSGSPTATDKHRGDRVHQRVEISQPSMSWASPFSVPNFPLQSLEPYQPNAPLFSDVHPDSRISFTSLSSSQISGIVDDNGQRESRISIMIQVTPGIRAYAEPKLALTVASLMAAVAPHRAEDFMDEYQREVLLSGAGQQTQSQGDKTVLELQLSLPSTQIRLYSPHGEDQDSDEANVVVLGIQQTLRIRPMVNEPGAAKLFTLHTTVDDIHITLARKSESGGTVRAAGLVTRDALLWMSTGKDFGKSFHISIRDCAMNLCGDEAAYLCAFMLRTVPMGESLADEFAGLKESTHRTLLFLLCALTKHSDGVVDPPMLSKMTYALRAFPQHYRNTESWKVLTRFRHVWARLSKQQTANLEALIADISPDTLESEIMVITSWAQWRNWDVPDVINTTALKYVLGHSTNSTATFQKTRMSLTSRIDVLRIKIDNCDASSGVVVEDMSIGLESSPPAIHSGSMPLETNKCRYTSFQVHSRHITITVGWNIYVIAEAVLPFVDQFKSVHDAECSPDQAKTQRSPMLGDTTDRHDVHIVVSTDDASLCLSSMTLRHVSRGESLKLSLVGSTHLNELYCPCASILINAESALTEFHGPSRCVWSTKMTSPSLYVDYRSGVGNANIISTVTLAAAYDELAINVVEQPLGLIHVVEAVLLDDVPRILQLVRKMRPDPAHEKEHIKHEDANTDQGTVLNVALLAGMLRLEIALLQNLSYELNGTATSLRVENAMANGSLFDGNIEVGRQAHAFVTTTASRTFRQRILQLPPVNGKIEVDVRGTESSFAASVSVERIEIEAAAIYGVVTVLNRPEMHSVVTAVNTGVADIQHYVEGLGFGDKETARKEAHAKRDRRIIYDVKLAMRGVRISASAPLKTTDESRARVMFGIGPLHTRASNRETRGDGNPLIPEIKAHVRDIGARLWMDGGSQHQPCGGLTMAIRLEFSSRSIDMDSLNRDLAITSDILNIDVYPETAATAVTIADYLHDKMRDLDLSKEADYLRHLRDSRKHRIARTWTGKPVSGDDEQDLAMSASALLSTTSTALRLDNLQVVWHVASSFATFSHSQVDDAVLSLSRMEFTTKGGNEARLVMLNLMLQLTDASDTQARRSHNSAVLPEIGFSVAYWSKDNNRSLAFRATGKPLDLRLESSFLIPLNGVQRSVEHGIEQFQKKTAHWESTPASSESTRTKLFDAKHLVAVLVEADFAGAQVYLQESSKGKSSPSVEQIPALQQGRYGQFAAEDGVIHTTLQTPGIALKVEYNSIDNKPTINGEMRIDASSNMLQPNVVPLILEISNSVKQVVQQQDERNPPKQTVLVDPKGTQKSFEEEYLLGANPSMLFGKTKVDLGLRICRQQFGLSCQPITRVDANAALDDFYLTINTIDSADEDGHFFAVSAVVSKLNAQVKHAYSRESTLDFEMDAVTLSLMNSKHLSGVNGLSAILKIDPTTVFVNGKQIQDLLLFREIWIPPEIRANAAPKSSQLQQEFTVQRYQMTVASASFPWNATVSIAKLDVVADLGRSIGKSSFTIANLWVSQQKLSSWEQNLCIGVDHLDVTSTGRLSGYLELIDLGIRMSIAWPSDSGRMHQTPLIQMSAGFDRMRAKAAFDYQAFAFGDVEGFDFLMYNVRRSRPEEPTASDRLVAVLDCAKAFVFCTSTSPAQAVGLYQAFERFVLERQTAYSQSLRDIEKHLRRESTILPTAETVQVPSKTAKTDAKDESPISLHTDVVVTLGAISIGVFPSTFFDSQMLKIEANSVEVRFAVGLENNKIHSGLGMKLGQFQVALAGVRRMTAVPKSLDVSINEVVDNALNAKGGTIVRVPKVIASMQTWQAPDHNNVDYVFKSLFDGKIDVGWNLSRINFIQNMWATHARALASRLGKALPESAVRITAGLDETVGDGENGTDGTGRQEKIRAEVNLPQFRYDYRALEPPIVETPQLRDMGEATPPLEWIGLNRDRLPNVTHQVVIVSLLKVAKEVEDAYERVLSMRTP